MLGEHGKYLQECIEGSFVGTDFLSEIDLSNTDTSDESLWRKNMVAKYLEVHPDRSIGTARNAIGFLWTVSFGLHKDDIVLASNGEGAYRVGVIDGDYYYNPGGNLCHRRAVKWLDKLIARKDMSQNLQN